MINPNESFHIDILRFVDTRLALGKPKQQLLQNAMQYVYSMEECHDILEYCPDLLDLDLEKLSPEPLAQQ